MTDSFENRLKNLAQELNYPPTPRIAEKVMTRISVKPKVNIFPRKLVWALTIIIITLISLMSIPTVRAAVIEFIQIGMVRIFVVEETTPEPELNILPKTSTPTITPAPLITILEKMMGEMTLEEAHAKTEYPIPLPTYPENLGEPDRVFVQDAGGNMTILVWLDNENSGQIKMSLHIIPPDSWAIKKTNPKVLQSTQVNGAQAAWTTGEYPLLVSGKNIEFTRLIEGHVLIWAENDLTYRLELELVISLEEAVKIAESLQTSPTP